MSSDINAANLSTAAPPRTRDRVLRQRKLRQEFPRNLPAKLATNVPKRILEWLYQFSLIILMIITFGFILVTPLDIIVQTVTKKAAAVKLFIIIAACATFVVISLLFYFSRLYHSRVMYNQIPARSAYLPLEKNDLPESLHDYILKTLQQCVGVVKVRAGPLANEKELFNYPGRVAPKYIQRRNIEFGLQRDYYLLPDDHTYQDIIDSIGLKLRLDGVFANTYTIPPYMTFREIFVALVNLLQDGNKLSSEMTGYAQRAIHIYEKAKFSGQLLHIEEIVEFCVQMEKVLTHCFTSFPGSVTVESLHEGVRETGDFESLAVPVSAMGHSLKLSDASLSYSRMAEYDTGWKTQPKFTFKSASADVLPYEPAPPRNTLHRFNSEQPSMYSQAESNISLTSSVLRVPQGNASHKILDSTQWDYMNQLRRF